MGFKKGNAHPRAVDLRLRLAELRQLDLGTLEITAQSVIRGKRSRQMVEVTCKTCGAVKNCDVDNIMAGRIKNCQCQRHSYGAAALRFGERYDAIVQRCNNENHPSYPNYGGRGIRCNFGSRKEFIMSMHRLWRQQGSPDLSRFDIHRIDNDGHYQTGNLRFVSRAENLRHRRTSVFADYRGQKINSVDLFDTLKTDYRDFSLSRSTTYRLARQGVSPDQILQRRPRMRKG